MTNRVVLALDQALRTTGWAVFQGDRLAEWGSFTVPTDKDMGNRLSLFSANVSELIERHSPDVVCLEDIQDQSNIGTFKILAFVQAAGLILCSQKGLEVKVLPPSHWRKVLGGGFGRKRDEQKQKAIELVKSRFDIEVESDVADAICIGLACVEEDKA